MRGSVIADVAFRNMLYVGGSYTLEANTTLPEDNARYGYYGVNGAFVFSELMDKGGIFSFGKVRASYGLVGLGTTAYATAVPTTALRLLMAGRMALPSRSMVLTPMAAESNSTSTT